MEELESTRYAGVEVAQDPGSGSVSNCEEPEPFVYEVAGSLLGYSPSAKLVRREGIEPSTY